MFKRFLFVIFSFVFFVGSLNSAQFYLKKYRDIYLIYSKESAFNKDSMFSILTPMALMFLEDSDLKIDSVSFIYRTKLDKDLYKRVVSSNDIFKTGREYLERPRYEVRIVIKKYLTTLRRYVDGFQVFLYDCFKKEYKLLPVNEDKLCSMLNSKLIGFSGVADNYYYFDCLGRVYRFFSKDFILMK